MSAAQTIPGTVHEAETCWYDTVAWPRWVDGLDHVACVEGDWPRAGSVVTWRSGPAGRGTVVERVSRHESLAGLTVEVQDDSIEGRQHVAFTPAGESVEVTLMLEYEIKQRNPFTALVDALFIRRAMEASLRTTLSGFGAELAARRSSEPRAAGRD